jgi:hypothetical protein
MMCRELRGRVELFEGSCGGGGRGRQNRSVRWRSGGVVTVRLPATRRGRLVQGQVESVGRDAPRVQDAEPEIAKSKIVFQPRGSGVRRQGGLWRKRKIEFSGKRVADSRNAENGKKA